eukprot:TRINITY_DN5458_c0_g1_i1.p1 TRINITY_DN5458_c0_g1~~TRINITY_DN5458_c0_g1_i1.p1  ORF type:complete len:1065 (+),score=195.19 TRINITY_DN5458_c0_g1_i1:83-3196(+)
MQTLKKRFRAINPLQNFFIQIVLFFTFLIIVAYAFFYLGRQSVLNTPIQSKGLPIKPLCLRNARNTSNFYNVVKKRSKKSITNYHHDSIPTTFVAEWNGQARSEATIIAPYARFQVLSDGVIRLEYNKDNIFEDRPSKVFWYRDQEVPPFKKKTKGNVLEIETDKLILKYDSSQVTVKDVDKGGGFTPNSLSIYMKQTKETWKYGSFNSRNLFGSIRTLDRTSGRVDLGLGLISREGWEIIDDSRSFVFTKDGWIESRLEYAKTQGPDFYNDIGYQPVKYLQASLDLYFFQYGKDYQAALDVFFRLSGSVPLVPRYILGNWWSKWWAYSDKELESLMGEFEEREIPLSVCVVDMDWHLVGEGDPENPGWTGYTWNNTLFPNPEHFVKKMHEKGLRVTLNLHPASGVYPHEEMYEEFAKFMGMKKGSKEPVPFDCTDSKFMTAYFKVLHHPHEEKTGIDFWWIDWQHGTLSDLPGVDPLFMLNHLHYQDMKRDNHTRPFVFSRWAGLGGHRYPIGFSGDSSVNWDMLAFQPYLTATSANVGFGWWSHDLGGFWDGIEDPELYLRWLQFGVFSPIFRLHSIKSKYADRRPWGFDDEGVHQLTKKAMQLRHALIPYIYTMAWRYSTRNQALLRPMYHEYGDKEGAYAFDNQYLFGSELIVAPFLKPRSAYLQQSRAVVWLPDEGPYIGFFDGRVFAGDATHVLYGGLHQTPVFARAGAIVPMGPILPWGGLHNPNHLHLRVYAGASNEYELYEDDGETLEYRLGKSRRTPVGVEWNERLMNIVIGPAKGDLDVLPKMRLYSVHAFGINNPSSVNVTIDGTPLELPEGSYHYDPDTFQAQVDIPSSVAFSSTIEIRIESAFPFRLLAGSVSGVMKDEHFDEQIRRRYIEGILKRFSIDSMIKQVLDRRLSYSPSRLLSFLRTLQNQEPDDMSSVKKHHLIALMEVMTGVGCEIITNSGPHVKIILFDGGGSSIGEKFGGGFNVEYILQVTGVEKLMVDDDTLGTKQTVPKLVVYEIPRHAEWWLSLKYFNILDVEFSSRQL